jgi:hypothetical protein
MARTSTVVWSLIALVLAMIVVLGLVYGPGLIREGKALVGPIVDMAKSEERLRALNDEFPFTEPAGGSIDEARFDVFLAIRRDLEPHYIEWQHMERELQRTGQEDWDTAMEVLAVIQTIMNIQVETLRARRMSPAEFVWIEDLVYGTWRTSAGDAVERSAGAEAVRITTAEDLEVLAGLERRYGSSAATRELRARFEARLAEGSDPEAPSVEGVDPATSKMLWAHRDAISELDLDAHSELHSILRGSDNIQVNIDAGDSS